MSHPPTTEVWIAWGDSETAGADDPANLTTVLPGYPPASGLYMLRSNEQWRALMEPCADGSWAPVGVGPMGIFGYLLSQSIGKDVAIVNGGVGGTRTDQWLPGQPAYVSLVKRAKAAVTRDNSYLGGYLCYIGANDAAVSGSSWTINTSITYEALQTECGAAPVVFAVLPPTVPTDMSYPTWATIRSQQQDWANVSRLAVDVPEGQWREAYKLHLNCSGSHLLAQNMLEAWENQ